MLRTGILKEGFEVGFRDPLGVADFVRVDLVLGVERQEKDVVDLWEQHTTRQFPRAPRYGLDRLY
jgi:hypothetical protein